MIIRFTHIIFILLYSVKPGPYNFKTRVHTIQFCQIQLNFIGMMYCIEEQLYTNFEQNLNVGPAYALPILPFTH